MRDYELLYIIKPEVAEEAIDGIVEKFNGILVKEGATVAEVDKWGKRKLAYEIDKKIS
jgi:small subunit ribosomal protein S6